MECFQNLVIPQIIQLNAEKMIEKKKNEYVLRNFKIVSSLICFQIEGR